ncbi:hypothetical protein D0T08_05610 [Emticicia sp. C21]|nr:hypothetical protein D0T08_05610 [Emticicia sp. C21]
MVEFFIVYKEKNKVKYQLIQIAYDRFKINSNEPILRSSNFDGWILKADWNDTLQEGVLYKNGKPEQLFNLNQASNAKVKQCNQVTITYQTVSGSSCGPNCAEITVTLHTVSELVCTNDTPSNGYPSDFGNYTTGGNDGNSTTYYFVQQYPLRSYNIQTAACRAGGDRGSFNSQVSDALYATGLATNITGWTLDKADALARATGGAVNDFFPLASAVGKSVGIAGVLIDGVQLYMGISEDGFQWNEDGWNLAQTALGVTGLVAAGVFAAPWVAVATGIVSIGIAVGTQVCQ